ncbi:MAG: discoidin domain-containing protein, partial [Clostridia bacterium]|nr:discoidin domain-containing protein [Clostridia bacterium]
TTMQRYVIHYGEPFTGDLRPYTVNAAGQYESGSVLLGASTNTDFTYKIKGVTTDGINGTFVKAGEDGVYTFTPNSEMRSGKIYVTLEIYNAADGTREWNGHKLDDVDLILEFQQSHEWNKAILERTTYVFAEGNVPASASEAYESGYAGNVSAIEQDNKNYSQNSNTDIWLYPYNDTYLNNPTYSPYVMTPNSVVEIKGKLYFPEAGIYRIYMRGRRDCVLYTSRDGGATYEKAAYIDATINPGNGYAFFPNDSRTYVDVQVEAREWIYFKEVVVIKDLGGKTSFVGLGMSSWTELTATTDEDGTIHYWNGNRELTLRTDEDGTIHYMDGTNELTAITNADGTYFAPAFNANRPPYATAYRQDYEFPKEFESDYFITRKYNYNYVGDMTLLTGEVTQTYIEGNYVGWSNTEEFAITNLFDGNPDTYIHSGNGNQYMVSESNPAVFTVELSEEITANILRLYPSHGGGSHPSAFPKNFYIEGSLDGETYVEMGRWTGKTAGASTEYLDFTLSDMFTFKYYRLIVTATSSRTARLALAEIEWLSVLSLTGNGNNFFSPDNNMFTYKGDWKVESCSASFGHVYVGKEATVEFTFEGTRLGIFSSKYFGKNYLVYVDGELVETIVVKEDNGDYSLSFLSPELADGKHSVVIYCPQEGNIDSIVIW